MEDDLSVFLVDQILLLATTYVYNKGEKDYPVTFAGLTKRDGSFIISRNKIDHFTLADLKGKHIIGGRKGGMPEMTLEYTLKENGIENGKFEKLKTDLDNLKDKSIFGERYKNLLKFLNEEY